MKNNKSRTDPSPHSRNRTTSDNSKKKSRSRDDKNPLQIAEETEHQRSIPPDAANYLSCGWELLERAARLLNEDAERFRRGSNTEAQSTPSKSPETGEGGNHLSVPMDTYACLLGAWNMLSKAKGIMKKHGITDCPEEPLRSGVSNMPGCGSRGLPPVTNLRDPAPNRAATQRNNERQKHNEKEKLNGGDAAQGRFSKAGAGCPN